MALSDISLDAHLDPNVLRNPSATPTLHPSNIPSAADGTQPLVCRPTGDHVATINWNPLHSFTQNEIWLQILSIACELTAWTQMLADPEHQARRWEPKRLRLRLFCTAGRLIRHARATVLRLPEHHPWADVVTAGLTRLAALAAPG